MARHPPLITININCHFAGQKYKIEILPTPWRRYRARFQRKNSTKFEEGTISDIFNRARETVIVLLKQYQTTPPRLNRRDDGDPLT